MDPLRGSSWSAPRTVSGFARSEPNSALLELARRELARAPGAQLIDIGCGAGRNAVPLARLGARVLGLDLSRPMLEAAARRARAGASGGRLRLALAPMEALPAADAAFDVVVAHGIWNLARSASQFRRAVAEAVRVARPGAGLFVFTFSRRTLPAEARPVAGEAFVFTQFSGEPQCFLTEAQLVSELRAAGFDLPPGGAVAELNRPRPGGLCPGGPVIHEGVFRRR
jgi:2-polyprenyl-6-hydroxyphenyl methylase/3-demethylubiquinone-9 3-methyltransferase